MFQPHPQIIIVGNHEPSLEARPEREAYIAFCTVGMQLSRRLHKVNVCIMRHLSTLSGIATDKNQ